MRRICALALLSVCLFAAPASADCGCSLPGKPIAKAVAVAKFVRPVKLVRAVAQRAKPLQRLRNVAAKVRPLRLAKALVCR